MKNLIEGLAAHEVLLMLLGSVLFFALIFVLIYKVVKNQALGKVLILFVLPVIMIGFSSFKKFEFLGLIGELKEKTEHVNNSTDEPSDKDLSEIEDLLGKLENKRINQPEVLLSVSKGNAALGDTLKAYEITEEALKKAPQNRQIQAYQKSLENPEMVRVLRDR